MFSIYFWIGFLLFMVLALALDLGVLNKKNKNISFKGAAKMTAIWFMLAMLFCSIIYAHAGLEKSVEFLTGYIVELSLSMDNVFVFIVIFSYFKIPAKYQHRVLFWGIIGAIIMRFIMITGGIYLFSAFNWLFYIFGAFLIFTGIKIAITKEEASAPNDKNAVMNLVKKFIPVSSVFDGNKFFTRIKGKLLATPLFVVLLLIEKTDLIFALDSIPAIIAITSDPFIVFTSNIFAIMGLRSLYFLLSDLLDRFAHLKYGIAIVLIFIGCKMILAMLHYHISTPVSLLVILICLGSSMAYSLRVTRKG
ncbi:MAG: TerC family protein [Rickettsiales bacterium]